MSSPVHAPGSPRSAVSVIILTGNEERNVTDCLASLDWADDVIVVDSFSRDETLDRARRARPDVRIFQNPFEDFGQQRNWALDETSPVHEWILFLDADERCTPKFIEAIRAAIADPGDRVGFFLCYRNLFLGQWIKRSTFYPSWQLRLLRRGEVRYRKEGHGQREVTQGSLGFIREPYDHDGFSKGVADWIARHNRYSTHEVELILKLRREPLRLIDLFRRDPLVRRRCLKRVAARLPLRPVTRFVYSYVFRGGFLDGRAGWHYCLLRASHEIHVEAKLAELSADRVPTRSVDPGSTIPGPIDVEATDPSQTGPPVSSGRDVTCGNS